MEIKPILTELDYQAALAEIDRLIEAQPGTSDGDRLDMLVTLVEAYENEHYPIPEPDDLAGILEYYRESRGIK